MYDKRLAVMMIGPIRPDIKSVIEHINYHKEQLKGIDYDFYFLTWKHSDAAKVRDHVDYFLELKEPTWNWIQEKITNRPPGYHELSDFDKQRAIRWVSNHFKMTYSVKIMCNFIKSLGIEYEFGFRTRTDVKVVFENIEDWFIKNGAYNIPDYRHIRPEGEGAPYFSDIFSISEFGCIEDAWDFGTLKRYNDIYSRAFSAEEIIKEILTLNTHSPKYNYIPIKDLILPPDRKVYDWKIELKQGITTNA
jgi:hypothetical protein